MSRPALKLAPDFKSKIEEDVASQLTAAGVPWEYEARTLEFEFPARKAKYTPDFPVGRIILEVKGRFGHRGANGADIRHRLVLVKEQHPDLDIRFIFQNSKLPIYKGSKTTYAKWADDHGFKWAEKIVPKAWLKEMKGQ